MQKQFRETSINPNPRDLSFSRKREQRWWFAKLRDDDAMLSDALHDRTISGVIDDRYMIIAFAMNGQSFKCIEEETISAGKSSYNLKFYQTSIMTNLYTISRLPDRSSFADFLYVGVNNRAIKAQILKNRKILEDYLFERKMKR